MTSSGRQIKKLQESLIDAFPSFASLEQMLLHGLDRNLRAIAGEGSLQDVVFKLIQAAKAQGWINELISAACNENPGNQHLKDIAKELLPNPDPEASPISSTKNPLQETNQLQKILILAAIPHGLRLDKEIREIEEAIRRATNRDLFEIKVRTAVRPQDIRRAIAEEQPQIVHFCGHGLKDGSLLLEDEGGNNKPVFPEALASLFELHKGYVKCVLLNACYSEKSAIEISQHIDYAVGMNKSIQEQAAIEFAKGFYDGLGYKNSSNQDVFQRAFDEAVVAIKLENISEVQIPILLINKDFHQLAELLRLQKWREADDVTFELMLKFAIREREGWIGEEDIKTFPCHYFQNIDSLWRKYSSNRFGFSVQKEIYLNCGASPDGNYIKEAWEAFGHRVGWKVSGDWVDYSTVNFSLEAPIGHLPTWKRQGHGKLVLCRCGILGALLFQRIHDCTLELQN